MLDVKLPINKVGIEDDGYHLMLKGKINGTEATFLVDTGASRTVFDKNQIDQYIDVENTEFQDTDKLSTGLGANNITSQIVNLTSIEFGDLFIDEYHAVILDLKHVNDSYQMLGIDKIVGVLGSDILDEYQACISYKDSEITFSIL